MRAILHRLGLVAFGIVAALIVAEVGLQVVAFAYRHWTGTRVEVPGQRVFGRTRIVCIGDSHTFGLWVDPQLSYPVQLQKILDESAGPGRFEVFNLGVPGTPSGSFRFRLHEVLDTFEPDIVIALLGVNNLLRDPDDPADTTDPVYARLLRALKQSSRLYGLYRYVARGWQTPPVAVRPEFLPQDPVQTGILRLGDRGIEVKSQWQHKNFRERYYSKERLIEDLDWMNAACRDRGIQFVAMTYLSKEHLYGEINTTIRAAAEHHLSLIDNELGQADVRPGLFFPDQHPRAAGYSIMARHVADFLLRAGVS